MSTAAAALTPNDLLLMGSAGKGYELVAGELREVEVSTESSHVAGEICMLLKLHCKARRLGWVFPEGTGYCCFPDDETRVRKPDTSFIARSRLSSDEYRSSGWLAVAPDLAIEVVSPNDNATGLEEKRREWLEAGVREVWIVYPGPETVHVYRANGEHPVFESQDTLTSPNLLPGFTATVAEFFATPAEPDPPTPPVQ